MPLSHIKVLDLSRYLPGPYGTTLLADFGADVLKVEQPREVEKRNRAFGRDNLSERDAAFHKACDIVSRNKRSILIDFSAPAGRDAILKLARQCDVMVHDYRQHVIEAAGLDYESVKAVNPRLIYVSVSTMGLTGPYAGLPGHDPVSLSITGALTRTGSGANDPKIIGLPISDVTAAAHSAFAIMVALAAREKTGEGQLIDLAMSDTAFALLTTVLTRYLPQRKIPPINYQIGDSGVFETKDGKHVVATNMEPPFWKKFCELAGRPDLIARFADAENRAEVFREVQAIYASRDRAEWFALAREHGLQIGPVLSLDEALDDPHSRARGNVVDVDHPVAGKVTAVGPLIKMSKTPPALKWLAQIPGESTVAVLREFGFDEAEIAALTGSE